MPTVMLSGSGPLRYFLAGVMVVYSHPCSSISLDNGNGRDVDSR